MFVRDTTLGYQRPKQALAIPSLPKSLTQRLQALGDSDIDARARADYVTDILNSSEEIDQYVRLRSSGEGHVHAYKAVMSARIRK